MKARDFICAIALTGFMATAAVFPTAEEPQAEVQVGVRIADVLALCREVYGPASTVISKADGTAACDTRTPKVAAK